MNVLLNQELNNKELNNKIAIFDDFFKDDTILYKIRRVEYHLIYTNILELHSLNYKFTQSQFNRFIVLATYMSNCQSFIRTVYTQESPRYKVVNIFFSLFTPSEHQLKKLNNCYYNDNVLMKNNCNYLWRDILNKKNSKEIIKENNNKLSNEATIQLITQLTHLYKQDKDSLYYVINTNTVPTEKQMLIIIKYFFQLKRDSFTNISLNTLLEQFILRGGKVTLLQYNMLITRNILSYDNIKEIINGIPYDILNTITIIRLYSDDQDSLQLLIEKYKNSKQHITYILNLVTVSNSLYIQDRLDLEQLLIYLGGNVDETSLINSYLYFHNYNFDYIVTKFKIMPTQVMLHTVIKTNQNFGWFIKNFDELYDEMYKDILKILKYKVIPTIEHFTKFMSTYVQNCGRSSSIRSHYTKILELFINYGLNLNINMINLLHAYHIEIKNINIISLSKQIKTNSKENIYNIYNFIRQDQKQIKLNKYKFTLNFDINVKQIMPTKYSKYFNLNKNIKISFVDIKQHFLNYIITNKLYLNNKLKLPSKLLQVLHLTKNINIKHLDFLIFKFY
jgi:hypothetical protein